MEHSDKESLKGLLEGPDTPLRGAGAVILEAVNGKEELVKFGLLPPMPLFQLLTTM